MSFFFNAREWETLEDSIWYVINDSISYQHELDFYSDTENHPVITELALQSFNLKIRTAYMGLHFLGPYRTLGRRTR